jgi:hypothetical protein
MKELLFPKFIFKHLATHIFTVFLAIVSRLGRIAIFLIPLKIIYISFVGKVEFNFYFSKNISTIIITLLIIFFFLFVLITTLNIHIRNIVSKLANDKEIINMTYLNKKLNKKLMITLIYTHSNIVLIILFILLILVFNKILALFCIISIIITAYFLPMIEKFSEIMSKKKINNYFKKFVFDRDLLINIIKALFLLTGIIIIIFSYSNENINIFISIVSFVVLRRLINSVFSLFANYNKLKNSA